MTAQEIITSSLRMIGPLRTGRTPSAGESADALWILNNMLDLWSIQRLFIYHIDRSTYTLTANTSTYTIGDGGTFDSGSPVRIERVTVILTDSADEREEVLKSLSPKQWSEVRIKARTAAAPDQFYNDRQNPLSTLHFYPVPTVAHDIGVYSWQILSSISDLSAEFIFPKGYADAVRYNLALRLAPEWGRVPRPGVAEFARDALAWVKRSNTPTDLLGVDQALLNNQSGAGQRLLDIN